MLRQSASLLVRSAVTRNGVFLPPQVRQRAFQTSTRTALVLDPSVSSLQQLSRHPGYLSRRNAAYFGGRGWRQLSTQDKAESGASESKPTEGETKEAGAAGQENGNAAGSGENREGEAEKPEKSELELAQEKIADLESQLADSKDHLLRALAETENVRARFTKEVESTRTYGIQKFAKQVVEVADNLQRAIESIPEDERTNDSPENHHLFALCEGVEMTRKELDKVFAANGIVEVRSHNLSCCILDNVHVVWRGWRCF